MTNSISFNSANANGDNVLSSQEIVDYLKNQNKSEEEIKAFMKNLTIEVDKDASEMTFQLDQETDLGFINYDELVIKDADESATDFNIFVVDTDGLIVDTHTVGDASVDGTSSIASVSLTDTDADGMTYVNNFLSVALDSAGWENTYNSMENNTNGTDQYELVYNIDNDVTLSGAVEGFGNELTINGNLAFEQNDDNGLNDGVINIKLDVSSTISTDLIYDVDIQNTVSTQKNVGDLAAGVEVHVHQNDKILATHGDLSVKTDSNIGTESTREVAYGYQLLNWVNNVPDDAPERALYWSGVEYNAEWIQGMANAMLQGKAKYDGVKISDFTGALKNGDVEIVGDKTENYYSISDSKNISKTSSSTNDQSAGTWKPGTAKGSWHGFTVTTKPNQHSPQNVGGTFFIPQDVFDIIQAKYPSFQTNTKYSNYTTGGWTGATANINSWTVNYNGSNVKVMDLIAGGGSGGGSVTTTDVTTGTATKEGVKTIKDTSFTAITTGAKDDFQLLFGDERVSTETITDWEDWVNNWGKTTTKTTTTAAAWNISSCRNCDPVAMIIFEEASGDLSGLKASTENQMNFLGEDFSNKTIELTENINNVEMQTGIFMNTTVDKGPTGYINQTVSSAESGQAYNVTGIIGDEASYVEGYTNVSGQVIGDQDSSRVYDGNDRQNDELRAFLLANTAIDINDYNTYTDDLLQFFSENPSEVTSGILDKMILAYAEGIVSGEKLASVLDNFLENGSDQDVVNVLFRAGYQLNSQAKDLVANFVLALEKNQDNVLGAMIDIGTDATLADYMGTAISPLLVNEIVSKKLSNERITNILNACVGDNHQELVSAVVGSSNYSIQDKIEIFVNINNVNALNDFGKGLISSNQLMEGLESLELSTQVKLLQIFVDNNLDSNVSKSILASVANKDKASGYVSAEVDNLLMSTSVEFILGNTDAGGGVVGMMVLSHMNNNEAVKEAMVNHIMSRITSNDAYNDDSDTNFSFSSAPDLKFFQDFFNKGFIDIDGTTYYSTELQEALKDEVNSNAGNSNNEEIIIGRASYVVEGRWTQDGWLK